MRLALPGVAGKQLQTLFHKHSRHSNSAALTGNPDLAGIYQPQDDG